MKLVFVTPHKRTGGKVIGCVCLLSFLPVCLSVGKNASSPDLGCSISAKYLIILLFIHGHVYRLHPDTWPRVEYEMTVSAFLGFTIQCAFVWWQFVSILMEAHAVREVCALQSCSFSYSYFASQKPLSVTELLLVIVILDLRILLVLLLVVVLYLVLVIAIWVRIGFLYLFYKYKYCFCYFQTDTTRLTSSF